MRSGLREAGMGLGAAAAGGGITNLLAQRLLPQVPSPVSHTEEALDNYQRARQRRDRIRSLLSLLGAVGGGAAYTHRERLKNMFNSFLQKKSHTKTAGWPAAAGKGVWNIGLKPILRKYLKMIAYTAPPLYAAKLYVNKRHPNLISDTVSDAVSNSIGKTYDRILKPIMPKVLGEMGKSLGIGAASGLATGALSKLLMRRPAKPRNFSVRELDRYYLDRKRQNQKALLVGILGALTGGGAYAYRKPLHNLLSGLTLGAGRNSLKAKYN